MYEAAPRGHAACVPRMAILGPEGKEAMARHCARAASLTFIAVSRVAGVTEWANVTLIRGRGAYVKRSPATNSVDLRRSAGCAGSRLGGPELQASGIPRRGNRGANGPASDRRTDAGQHGALTNQAAIR